MKGVHEVNNNLHMVCVLFYLVVMVALETVPMTVGQQDVIG